jgi:hypothetical protein
MILMGAPPWANNPCGNGMNACIPIEPNGLMFAIFVVVGIYLLFINYKKNG